MLCMAWSACGPSIRLHAHGWSHQACPGAVGRQAVGLQHAVGLVSGKPRGRPCILLCTRVAACSHTAHLTTAHAAPDPPTLPTGEARRAREKIAAYKHLSEAQKAKLLAALEAKERAGGAGRQPGPQELRTEVIMQCWVCMSRFWCPGVLWCPQQQGGRSCTQTRLRRGSLVAHSACCTFRFKVLPRCVPLGLGALAAMSMGCRTKGVLPRAAGLLVYWPCLTCLLQVYCPLPAGGGGADVHHRRPGGAAAAARRR